MKEDISNKKTSKKGLTQARRNKLIFYSILIAFPVLHYLVFYVYINFNSFILAFREYYVDSDLGVFTYRLVGFDNFLEALKILKTESLAVGNSFLLLAIQLFITTPLALLFSFYIYKKCPGTEFFRVMLFLPSVLSAVVFGLLYRYICGDVAVYIQEQLFHVEKGVNLLTDPSHQLFTVIIFNILMGFGVSVLTYSGTMSGINISLIESAELDGCNPLQEFIKIVIPMIWPTVVTLMIVSFSRVFTEQWQVYTLLQDTPGNATNLGYYLYARALYGSLEQSGNNVAYTVLSALGLILTVLVLPATMIMRWALNKYGPKAD